MDKFDIALAEYDRLNMRINRLITGLPLMGLSLEKKLEKKREIKQLQAQRDKIGADINYVQQSC